MYTPPSHSAVAHKAHACPSHLVQLGLCTEAMQGGLGRGAAQGCCPLRTEFLEAPAPSTDLWLRPGSL